MDAPGSIRRFFPRHIVHHLVVIGCFVGLVVTGFPQKYNHTDWARGVALILGGVERMRWLHHFLGTVMALQLLWHVVELVWLHFVRRLPMTMWPRRRDLHDAWQHLGFSLGFRSPPPRLDRYTFVEKLEYLALLWGTAIMVATGLLLLYPVHFAAFVPGEVIPAAKAAHGGEALLALLAVGTWHFYFVHVRRFNPSIFTGRLPRRQYEEEHALELETVARGGRPRPAPIAWRRLATFGALAALLVAGTAALWAWLGSYAEAVTTLSP